MRSRQRSRAARSRGARRQRSRRVQRDLCANGRHCQGAGIAKEQVAQGNLLRILTAGDDVEDEDEDIGDAEAIDDRDPWTAPADGCRRQFVKGSLFNLEEKSSCRFSADAGSGIVLCNSWLIVRKAAVDRQRRSGNRPTGEERLFADGPAMRRYSDMRVGLDGAQMSLADRDAPRDRPLVGRLAPQMN
jgi:hypothetical protein